jgi:hypothetical protein
VSTFFNPSNIIESLRREITAWKSWREDHPDGEYPITTVDLLEASLKMLEHQKRGEFYMIDWDTEEVGPAGRDLNKAVAMYDDWNAQFEGKPHHTGLVNIVPVLGENWVAKRASIGRIVHLKDTNGNDC